VNLVSTIADGIERQEGYFPGSLTYRNNNPGAIWDGLTDTKKTRIWPQYPIDGGGFLTLPDYSTGRALEENQVALKISRGVTLRQLLAEWSNTDGAAYSANVAEWSGLPTDTPLNLLDASPGSSVLQDPLAVSDDTGGGQASPDSSGAAAVYIGAGLVAATLFVSFLVSD
jgi:hypothetical protein